MTVETVDPRWLLAALPGAIIAARDAVEIEIGLEDVAVPAQVVADALASGTDAGALASLTQVPPADAQGLLETLRTRGALATAAAAGPTRPASGLPLAEAIVLALAGRPVDAAWTADEVILVPPGADAALTSLALRAFVSGLRPAARLRAYAHVAATGDASCVHGDVPPDPQCVEQAIAAARAAAAAAADGTVQVLAPARGERLAVPAGELARLGFGAPHRLGPLLAVESCAPPPGGAHAARALRAAPTLRHPGGEHARATHGLGRDPATAELVARAEAAERYALGDPTGIELVRAPAAELDGAVSPAALHRHSARQRAAHDLPEPGQDDALLWTRATTIAGAPRWVPAGCVLVPFDDPDGPPLPPVTSSGAAAHTTREQAIERALLELVERDAFLWTWVQGVARERIDLRSLPERAAAQVAALQRAGQRVELVNLTLDTAPVVLCVLHGPDGLALAAAARLDPVAAAERALAEAGLLAVSLAGRAARPLTPELVRSPQDHLDLHRQAGADTAAFLTAGAELIDLGDVAGTQEPLVSAVTHIGEPLVVDLTTPSTAPFQVVRVLVPGLVPMSFGWDSEPLGIARLTMPIRTCGGQRVGRRLHPESMAPVQPHPFA